MKIEEIIKKLEEVNLELKEGAVTDASFEWQMAAKHREAKLLKLIEFQNILMGFLTGFALVVIAAAVILLYALQESYTEADFKEQEISSLQKELVEINTTLDDALSRLNVDSELLSLGDGAAMSKLSLLIEAQDMEIQRKVQEADTRLDSYIETVSKDFSEKSQENKWWKLW
jgi:hypothetical protein